MRLMIVPVMLASMMPCSAPAQIMTPQAVTIVAGAAAAPGKRPVVLPIMSEVMVTLDTEIDSGRVKVGDSFPVSVSRDVVIGDYLVIPRGTPGTGEIAAVTRKGGFGKSGKLEIDLRSLTLPGGSLPLSGHFELIGRDNDTVTIGAVAAVGVFSGFVTGHSAVVGRGREFRGFTRASLPIAPAAN